MATEKKINSRIQQKHDVAANWAKATNFIPKKGELIIYDAEYNTSGVETTPVRFKIGNGSATVNALPFVKTDNGVKLGGGTVPSGLTGPTADSCIDQVYANILDDGSQRNYFPQLMSRIESGQLLLMGIDLSTEMAIHIMHITGVIENEVTASQGTPVEGSNDGVYHFIIAEKFAESGSEKFLLWAEKTGSAFSKYRSASTGSTETFSASVTAGWNSNYVNTTTGLCNFNSLVSGGNFTWVLMSTAMAGQDTGATPTGNYFFAGSPFTIEYEAQVGQMAVLDRQLSGGYRKGYYIGSANLESSNSTWQNYQAGTDIGSSIVFNTALKNSTIGACLSNICSLSPSGNCIVRTYRDDVATYKVVPILSDGVDGNGEWTLYAGAMLVGSAGSYYGLFEASHPLTMKDPFGDAAESIYDWNQWVNLSSTGAWMTNAGSRKAKYVNFEALSLLYQYAMFGEYNIIKLPLRKVAEAQGSYAKVLAEAVQDKQDKLSDGQIAAANSGVTAAKVTKYDGYENIINGKQDKITSTNKLSSDLVSGLGAAAAKAVDTAISANSTSTNLPTSKAVEDRINAHSGIDKVGTITGIKMNSTSKGTSGVVDLGTVLTKHQSIKSINTNNTAAQTVNASEAIAGSGTINLHKIAKTGNYNDLLNKPTIPSVSGKLNKTTYEYNEELALGSNGKVLIGIFPMYDTNLTVHISSTTSTTYSGTLVIATQNFGGPNRIIRCNLYGDATGTLHSCLVVQQSSDVTDSRIFIYGNFAGWSKNLVHIQAVGLAGPPEELMVSATTIPTTDLVTIHNVLDENFAKLTGNNKFTGDMSGVGHPYRVFPDEEAYVAYQSNPQNVKYTSQTNAALIINTDANNRTAFVDGRIDNKKNGTKYELTLPAKTGTLAITSDIPDVSGKANLSGGNTFTNGIQRIQDTTLQLASGAGNNDYLIDCFDREHEGETIFGVVKTGVDAGEVHIGDGIAKAPILLGNSAGTAGQVLTSQGAGNTPIWKELVTLDTDQDITGHKTFTTPQSGGPKIGIYNGRLSVRSSSTSEGGIIWDTPSDNIAADFTVDGNGAHLSLGVDAAADIVLNGDSGTAGQVLTSQGANMTPQWKSMPTYSLSGTTLTITLP